MPGAWVIPGPGDVPWTPPTGAWLCSQAGNAGGHQELGSRAAPSLMSRTHSKRDGTQKASDAAGGGTWHAQSHLQGTATSRVCREPRLHSSPEWEALGLHL